MRFKEGNHVRIIKREVSSTDVKNGTFYRYFCGLAGVVDRIYDKEICVRVDPESLPEDILKRHLDIQESIRQKWLNGLSGEARNKLRPEEKRFELAYTILVQSTDLESVKPGEAKPVAIKSMRPLNPPKTAPEQAETPQKLVAEKAGKPARKAAAKPAPPEKVTAKEEPGKPLTSADLEAAELAFLKEREKALKRKK